MMYKNETQMFELTFECILMYSLIHTYYILGTEIWGKWFEISKTLYCNSNSLIISISLCLIYNYSKYTVIKLLNLFTAAFLKNVEITNPCTGVIDTTESDPMVSRR